MKAARFFGSIAILVSAHLASAQIQIGETTMRGSGNVTAGYSGSYGDDIQSNHGLNLGASSDISGSYFNPNFLNFSVTPYYNQSRSDSTFQSLTSASGFASNVNFFNGTHFPGSFNFHRDNNSTGTFGLEGTPNFTTRGDGQGLGVSWSALLPDLPSLTVGYQEGSGSGNLYGTDERTSSKQQLFNVHSSYTLVGFRVNGYYDHTSFDTRLPQFLTGGENQSDSSGHDFGVNSSRNVPLWHGSMYAGYSHSTYSTDYMTGSSANSTTSGYTADNESAGISFHPTLKLSFNVNQNYTSNLSAYLSQNVGNTGSTTTPVVNLGTGAYSNTFGGGVSYQFTRALSGSAQATHYTQSYFGNTYSGTFVSGSATTAKKLWDTFSFSVGVVDSSSDFGNNNLGFVGNVNYFHRFGFWETSGSFSYAQNVQSVLITETTSYYTYNANLHRKFSPRVQWTAAFNGSHSGLSTERGGSSSSEGYSTSISLRKAALSALYSKGTGNSILTSAGLVNVPLLPGELASNVIAYNARSYGGSLSLMPIPRLIWTGTYSRSLSDTASNGILSRNNTEIIYSQLQYRLRRISLIAGYTRFSQGFTYVGPTNAPVTSYYGGISRWFNLF